MKRKLIVIAFIVICVSLIAGGTLAYFTTEATARNVITAGAVEVAVVEQQLVDGTLQPYPSQPIQIMPGTTVSKIVSAQSTEQPAWIRMTYDIVIYDAEGKVMELSEAELAQVVTVTGTADDWTLRDGWWYYDSAVAAGAHTEPLFESVAFSGPEMDNEYQNCEIQIRITAQAVQQANNGSTVMEAVGWPALGKEAA